VSDLRGPGTGGTASFAGSNRRASFEGRIRPPSRTD